MPAPVIPAHRLREGLETVRDSIEQFSQTYRTWLTLTPSYSHGPSQLPALTLSKAYCPISGPRWNEYRTRLHSSNSIKGLTILRNQVLAELLALDKFASQNGNWNDPHPFSNGIHHMHYWEEILYVAFTSGPITSIQDRFNFDLKMAVKRRKKLPRNKEQSVNSQSVKVDVVSKEGGKWTRMCTTKPERLRAEFREAESYMVESEEEDEEERGASSASLGQTSDPAMDPAARNCSLMKTIRELRAAADTEAKARVERSAETGRPNILEPIEVEIVVTRIELPWLTSSGSLKKQEVDDGTPFYEKDEQVRFQARLRAIVREAQRLDVKVIPGFRRLPVTGFEYPSVAIEGSNLPMGLPQVARPPPQPKWQTTDKINLDVTALIAFASDTTHGIFPSDFQQAPQPSEDGSGTQFQHHFFRTFSIRKEALEARAAELMLQDDQQDEAKKAMDSAVSKEGRALAIQLEREMTLETLFDALLDPIQGRTVELYATIGAFDRLRLVSSTVGGPNEKRRVKALLGEDGATADDFWRGSKWAGPEHAKLRSLIRLPVKPLSDLGPGGFDHPELARLYPDLHRQHFISHMVDTLESCLTELWGSDWRDISQDLPKSKYKKLKQNSVHQAGGQTYTTLRSMHACARYGMTTLTSNMDSIQWLLKEMNRRPYSAETRAIIERADQQDVEKLFDSKATYYLCFLLLHPRSLSEQMRVTTTAPPWRVVLDGYPGDSTPDQEIQIGQLPVLSRGTSTVDDDKQQSPFLDQSKRSPSSLSFREGNAPRTFLTRLQHWIEGPRPHAKLRIRHYKWWPFVSVERFWMRATAPVAWKDPHRDAAGLPGPKGPADETQLLGYDWWRNIAVDLKVNRLHWSLLSLVYIAWILGFASMVKSLWFDAMVTGPDGIARTPYSFSCTSTYWLRNGECGLNGQDCAPFLDSNNTAGTAFRCPSQCTDVTLLNPRSVGDQEPNYVPLVVGGGDASQTYRSDSFVCAAAIHAGVLDNSKGGCGSVRLVGSYADYLGVDRNGIDSIGFDSTFPSSFRFEQFESQSDCTDRRWQAYVLNVIMISFVGFVLRPKRWVWFWTLACVGYWHINMASEPRDYPPPVGSAISDFLPYLFFCYAIYRLTFRYVWPAFERLPIEREIWTLGFWWIGVLMNVVFANVPIQRLMARDIAQQPGSLTALIIIVVMVIIIAINQVRVIRKTGYLPKYLTLYIIGGILIGLAAAVPGESLRIHHYIIALALLPACAFPTRLSLIYISLLLGVFTNGIARWGFDGLLQDTAVVQGDATGGTSLPTFTTTPTTFDGVIRWDRIPQSQLADWNGFHLLIDDVLRYTGDGTEFDLNSRLVELFSEGEGNNVANQTVLDSDHYVRLAFASHGSAGDYTMPAVARIGNRSWVDPKQGAT